MTEELYIGWTTTESVKDAERLANSVVENKLAACAQIDGPITSIYTWKGKVEKAEEYRLQLKFMPAKTDAILSWIKNNHPYENPEWVVQSTDCVKTEYLKWVQDVCRQ